MIRRASGAVSMPFFGACPQVVLVLLILFQVEQPRDLARDSGQRKLTYSFQNHCAAPRSIYLPFRILISHLNFVLYKMKQNCCILIQYYKEHKGEFYEKIMRVRSFLFFLRSVPKLFSHRFRSKIYSSGYQYPVRISAVL